MCLRDQRCCEWPPGLWRCAGCGGCDSRRTTGSRPHTDIWASKIAFQEANLSLFFEIQKLGLAQPLINCLYGIIWAGGRVGGWVGRWVGGSVGRWVGRWVGGSVTRELQTYIL